MSGWQESFYLAFSPDSKTIAALRGPEVGKRKLVLIDVASGAQRVVASGYFSGFSFSPDGNELVYAQGGERKATRPDSDVYRVSTAVAGGNVVSPRLTHDHRSLDPLWGPNGKIVFVKLLGAKQRKYGPKNELFLIEPERQGREAPHPHQGRPAAAGPLPDRVVGQRQAACWPSSRARTRATRSPSTRRRAPSGRSTSDRGRRASSAPRSRADGKHGARLHRRLRTRSRPQRRHLPLRRRQARRCSSRTPLEPDWSR